MVGTYNTAQWDDPIVEGIRKLSSEPDDFWKSEENKYVSYKSVGKGVEVVTIAMTRKQWEDLFEAID